ncbi:sugar ABC transporter ATP-binding protein [Streptomyces sp. SDT5-1]|uniref:sugar ABC transporter ATP-binding protein n=1 Tax=Streptomyces sp. SDT5-1 TaxID=3406418 RepID=UPI003FCFC3EB
MNTLLTVSGLSVDYGRRPARRVVSDVSFTVEHGETVALVGESGSGKTTIGRAVLGLVRPSEGTVVLEGRTVDVSSLRDRRGWAGTMQAVFQDPGRSLNPSLRVGTSVAEPLTASGGTRAADRAATVARLIRRVGLPEDTADRYPGQFSGGQRQRIGIARALVVGPRSVLENVWLGADGVLRRKVSEAGKRARAAEVLAELLGAAPDLDTPVERLSLSDRQACGIARALVRDPKVLVLDEATSALDVATRDRLFQAVARRTADGMAVLFVSHRMDEVDAVCDRVSVLRSGESVATLDGADATTAELVRLMTGAEHLTDIPGGSTLAHRTLPAADAPVVLRVSGLRLGPDTEPVDFELRAGELVGLAGLEGHGQDAFIKALWHGPAGEGAVTRLEVGGEREIRSQQHAASCGIGYVPRDRRGEALFGALSIRENFSAATQAKDARGGLLSRASALARFAEYRSGLKIRMGRASDPITTLSGGNQQKVVIARWLAHRPDVLLLNDPTRGVDIGAKRDIYALLDELTARGVAVVMLSTEVDEHIELMDRVLVFRENCHSTTLDRQALTRGSLVAAFFGRTVTPVAGSASPDGDA